MLAAIISQLNEYGVEVLWAQGIQRPAVWIASHSLLILRHGSEGVTLAACCTEILHRLSQDPRS